MSEGALQVARHEGVVVLRLEGELRHLLADALERSIELQLAPGMRQLVIDLEHATFMDSTVIGMLVLAARRAADLGAEPPLLICPDVDLWQQLVDLHLDTLFQRLDAEPDALPRAAPVSSAGPGDPRAQAALVLKAHRALIQHDPRNAETFKDLLAVLEAEMSSGDPAD
ncbi:STAS domain-containing protein [Pseudomarimonas salicorniae]|uniref:STAS domain-containing protein n=1 Tax=Pseudomarimonas salicorniae TaxID=2933270 RepID=A0ABT0GG76_9GAMM|nr:STAS domain-containing protein [Lysobacter sp. CAU 1642]MCK7593544.1 STAS domain-containing protein [Lysobacter sp. CAU 1642]